ncbi:lipid-A-disaccharide synthase-related protein [Thermus sp.]|uniref:lipid-A-disaccharide synthase-related protein n=1 Tax=Thermus sp. TaxID=275 RepID=UPI0026004B97|nr:lipid-A-disaccharide synthase-related protein [Thermus sp.]MCS6868084.1 lipid-A-disaccharide synthase-related protein [Thermus sp.]MCX7849940.1 lipid-A-disaccharide synthase-related protein [Thermus sp.]MDW8357359.1 lipid-A-disaccharide synthase-related protein [Thermus sp.]
MRVLFVSNGPTEDAIGARIAQGLGLEVYALPLVGRGLAYEGVAREVLGPRQEMPSGGFLFGSLGNLLADLRAGFLSMSLAQWRAAWRFSADAVVVVGDAYALSVGLLAARGKPLYHVNPLVSAHYLEQASPWEVLLDWGGSDFTPYERLLQRRARAVFVRDGASLQRLRRLGVAHAYFYGSFAMDLLSPPERDLTPLLGQAPLLALLPGTRGDEAFSLPRMLEASRHIPLTAAVAWPKAWEALPPLPGWNPQWEDAQSLRLEREGHTVWVLRGAFSAILHRSRLALATAGTAAEQAAGLGIPIVAFPTPGPQYTRAFARRQKRLLGEALHLVEPDPYRIAGQALLLLQAEALYRRASQAGRERIGPPGGIRGTLEHIRRDLLPPGGQP